MNIHHVACVVILYLNVRSQVLQDSDVLAWLKSTGGGYQTRINNFLRLLTQRAIGLKRIA